LAYLADVFGIPNMLNISLHGTKMAILKVEEDVQSFQENSFLLFTSLFLHAFVG
jgi:hypothetical protein